MICTCETEMLEGRINVTSKAKEGPYKGAFVIQQEVPIFICWVCGAIKTIPLELPLRPLSFVEEHQPPEEHS